MLFSSAFVLLLSACTAYANSFDLPSAVSGVKKPYPSSCTQVRSRKEVRDLTDDEWSRFVSAVQKLTSDPSNNLLKKLGDIHNNLSDDIHFKPQFLPFHRYFLYQFEAHLLEIDANVIIPYWDSTLDANAPADSAVLSSSYYGTSGAGTCIKDGPFANIMIDKDNCVQRNYNSAKANFPSSSLVGQYIRDHKDDTFLSFANWVEVTPHPFPHLFVGGSMSSMKSPYDPLFFAHHAFVDKVWDDWQLQNAGDNKQKMDGGLPQYLSGFTDIDVASVWTVDKLCYQYIQSSAYSKNVTDNGNNNNTTGVPTWNTNFTKLPDSWITMNGGNVSKVRSVENKTQQVNDQVIQKGQSGNPPSGPGVEVRKALSAVSAAAVATSSHLALFGFLSVSLFFLF